MMHSYFKNLEKGLEISIRKNPKGTNARKKYALSVAQLGTRLYDENERIAWCGVVAPFDLLNALGVTSCFAEFVGAMLAATGTAENFITTAEHSGYTTDSCAYHRAVIGAMLRGVMPVPDFLIATSSPCTSGLTIMENMAKAFGKKMFVLNIPQKNTSYNVNYLAAQIREMTNFVSQHTKKPLNKNNLEKAINLSNKAREVMLEAFNIASRVPSPVSNKLMRDFAVICALLMGTETGVDVCKALRDELINKSLLQKGKPINEKLRIMWIQNRIQFKNPVDEILENMGVKIVVDELNTVAYEPIDYNDPYTSIAKRLISFPLSSNSEQRINNLKILAKKYCIDGAINPCHWGCRQGAGIRGLITNGLRDIGVPVLNLEIDCVDSRNFSEEQLRTRIEAFIEMLSN